MLKIVAGENAGKSSEAQAVPPAGAQGEASPAGASAAARAPSPMMAQYLDIKARNPGSLLFYRMGDFYELFFSDAEAASKALGIVLTKRGKHLGEDIPMCGVPVERAQDYLHRLISQGFRVAVCEQVEDPAEAKKRGGKSVVRREVRRLVTPGTLTEDALLEPARANRLMALARREGEGKDEGPVFGYAALDISTGEFLVGEAREAELEAEAARLDPAEIVVPEALADLPALRSLSGRGGAALSPLGRAGEDETAAARRLRAYFGLATLDGLGPLSGVETIAAAAALLYVERTQFDARPALRLPSRQTQGAHMAIDAATRASLELTKAQAGGREGSLLDVLDRCAGAAGSRLLAERLAAPLTDPEAIARRLDAVEAFVEAPALRRKARALLKAAPDPMRALSRLALDRGGPRDLAALRDAALRALDLERLLREEAGSPLPEDMEAARAALAALDPAPLERLQAALADDPPLSRREGGFVRPGFDAALDEMRALRDDARQVAAGLQARYCELAQSRQLKLRRNAFLGFFLEAPRALGEKLLRPPFDATFVHRQTMADAMRFSTKELAELEARLAGAADEAIAREEAIFAELAAPLVAGRAGVSAAADALAQIDVAAALAEVAADCGWSRPQVNRSLSLLIEGGRHPVVEAALRAEGKPFVANDCDLSGFSGAGGRLAVVTGPNMAGKSTYLRQTALIAALAQMGSFTPARRARIGVVDRLFSRVGASDDLARGRSTFMVEMVETAAILNCATERSLVVLDEIGRGTATFDGLSIAWAALEHLNAVNRSRALFATHFHELTQLARRLERVDNLTVRVAQYKGEPVFLHEIVAGAADRSYGVQVARLAGLPQGVVARAKLLLREFEAGERDPRHGRLLADLPLFSAAPAPALEAAEAPVPFAAPSPLEDALDALDPDALSPREALEALYKLKALRGEKPSR
ncbi:DNA mismatch repair protein MutS [Methylocella sp.]|uniref:DNA mismatch repair protein MutS n=1 Tax=Methylocella sp. TaxID=1978226 RepID=UPI003783BAA6